MLALALAGGVLTAFCGEMLSVFPLMQEEKPLHWWSVTSAASLVALFGGLAAACALEPWMRHAGDPRHVFPILTGLVLVLISGALMLNMFGGVAIYPDRIEQREPSPWARQIVTPLRDIRFVEVGCVYGARDEERPSYALVKASGDRLYLTDGLGFPRDRTAWLRAVRSVDDAMRASDKPRQIASNVFGHPNDSSECVAEFAKGFGPSSNAARRLLEPLPY
ncbi:MAG: hypothetical protein Q7U20_08665 [Caulobacter sp.]|nr:hypothetical protein [Caulobacter sp.]